MGVVSSGGVALRFTPVDRATLGYDLFVLAFVILFWRKIPSAGTHLLFNLSVVGVVFLMRRLRGGSLFRFLRSGYPLILFTFFYYQTGLLNRILVPEFLDPLFLSADRGIFGEFPGILLRQMLRGRFWSEFFHFFYSSYYIVIPLTAVGIFLRKRGRFEEYMFQVSLLFYICYAIYIFLPVEGPLHLRALSFDGGGFFERLVDFLYAKGENPGAAFPSSHVAVALLVAWWSRRVGRAFSCVVTLCSLFLSVATVYCMFHYAVDVFAGVFLAVAYVVAVGKLRGEDKGDDEENGEKNPPRL